MTARAVPLVRTRCWLALGLALAVAACLPAPEPPIDHGSFEDVRRIVAALDDVAGEYHLAVGPDGRELDPVRRRILRALMHDAQVFAQRFGAGERDALATIAAAVDAGGPPAGVEDAARRLRAGMLARRRLVLAPGDAVGRPRAEALWHTHCAGCHGPTGVGDGAQGLYLEPEPKNFHEPEVMAGMTASRAQSRIADGMRETAMPSWGLLSTTERWALAFLIMAFQHDEAAVARGRAVAARRGLALSLPWQADRSDGALVAELVARGLAADEAADVVAFARAEAAFAPTGGRLAGARRQLDVARHAYRERRFAAAAAELGRVRRTVRDDLEAIRVGAPRAAARLEEQLVRLGDAIRAGALEEIVDRETAATHARLDDAERALSGRTAAGAARLALERGALAALALGLLLGARRPGRAVGRGALAGGAVGLVAAAAPTLPAVGALALGTAIGLVARGRWQAPLRAAGASGVIGATLGALATAAPPAASAAALVAVAVVVAAAVGASRRWPRVAATLAVVALTGAAASLAGRAAWLAWLDGHLGGALVRLPRCELLGVYPTAAATCVAAAVAAVGALGALAPLARRQSSSSSGGDSSRHAP